MKRKKGFTLIELIAVLVIMAIIVLIVTSLIMSIIRSAKISARKRSIDNYGKSIELAITSYLLDNGSFPTDISQLNIEYSGSKVECGFEHINNDTSIYLEDCKVNDRLVENYTYGIDKRTAVEVLLSKTNSIDVTNYNDGNTGEMYTFDHEATEQTPALTDYRYIGSDPYNYVEFNNELWRIIGVFTVDDGSGNYDQRIKIVRNEKFSSITSWNKTSPYENDWTIASLNIYLNGAYYNRFNLASQNMVVDTKYYLGGVTGDYYSSERGITVYNGRKTNWTGKIALLYPSDYIYTFALGVDDTCYNDGGKCYSDQGGTPTKSWIYNSNDNVFQWLLSPSSSNGNAASYIASLGYLLSGNFVGNAERVRPTLYLSSQVKITSGTGKSDDPYQLSMN